VHTTNSRNGFAHMNTICLRQSFHQGVIEGLKHLHHSCQKSSSNGKFTWESGSQGSGL